MISNIALKHFDQIWELFDGMMFDARGAMFSIDPFRQFFPLQVAEELTIESSHRRFHEQLARWGRLEQMEHEIEIVDEQTLPDGHIFRRTQFKDPEVRWARGFILTAFHNLCCLATYKQTIEELIYQAWQYMGDESPSPNSLNAYYKLMALSRSFLLSEWSRAMTEKAIANDHHGFFAKLSDRLLQDKAKDNFVTGRSWLAVSLLWYLGGREIEPRREFLHLLKQKSLMANAKDVPSFNAELGKMRLI